MDALFRDAERKDGDVRDGAGVLTRFSVTLSHEDDVCSAAACGGVRPRS